MPKRNILDYSLEELKSFFQARQIPPYRAQQIFKWIYQGSVCCFREMSNLPSDLQEFLDDNFEIALPALAACLESKDRTKKYLFGLSDGQKIETVVIPSKNRTTICVSTQVGCKFSCSFCASGLKGFKRNLSTGEIISQILYVKSAENKNITHLVFMGVGEPFDNYDNLLKAIKIINGKEGFNIGARRITISTCGLPEKIRKFAAENLQVELAVSLHSADDETRSQLMPVNKKYPLSELIKECRSYAGSTNRQITFEYLLIKDLTCTLKAAQELASLLKGMIAKVNLICYNEVKELPFKSPSEKEIKDFQAALTKLGVVNLLRTPRGRDISAACGQLRIKETLEKGK